jgi:hypothetical protein
MIVFGRRRDQQRIDAGSGKRDGAHQSGWPAADDGRFGSVAVTHRAHENPQRSP